MDANSVSNRKAAAILAVMAVVTGIVAYLCLRPAQPQSLPPLTLKDPPAATAPATHSADTSDSDDSKPEAKPGTAPTAPAKGSVTVHVTGAVNRPGVYELLVGSRVADAITMAGGATPQGDPNSLNMAERIQDGSKIVVPVTGSVTQPANSAANVSSQGEAWVPTTSHSGPAQQPPSGTEANAAPTGVKGQTIVNLNTATEADLRLLPGVGAATAAKILEYRQQHGSFQSVDELRNVRGIGDKRYQRLIPCVTVN